MNMAAECRVSWWWWPPAGVFAADDDDHGRQTAESVSLEKKRSLS